MWAIILSGTAPAIYLLPSESFYAPHPIHYAIFAASFLYWAGMFTTSLYHHHEAHKSAKQVKELVTAGPYAYVRHPIYSADILFAWGITLVLPKANILVCAAWLTTIMMRWMILEEKALTEKFGEAYKRYQDTTPMLIPKITRPPRYPTP
jgi:protein-S-isoprenylcysteine O-methyltransferase Ste14